MSPLPEPAFALPLQPAELELIGRIALTFAQIDDFVAKLTGHLYGIPLDRLDALVGEKMLSARLDYLKEASKWAIPAYAEQLNRFVADMKAIVPQRNLMLHGTWGRFTDDYANFKAGPWSRLKPSRRLYVEELPALHERACAASHALQLLLTPFGAIIPDGMAATITYTTSDKPPDKGFWTRGSIVFYIPPPVYGKKD
ncbi:hypothetical protein [Ancylobacter sp. IITR112]|uniref:hypothetical protein n=1 Tax=Ancylobacter sp. IITR112 TaxID=3138073 RepID=UPI00352ADDD7